MSFADAVIFTLPELRLSRCLPPASDGVHDIVEVRKSIDTDGRARPSNGQTHKASPTDSAPSL